MYAKSPSGSAPGGVPAQLAQVRIDPIAGQRSADPFAGTREAVYDARTGQLLQNRLRDYLNPDGRPANPAYRLAIELEQQSIATSTLSNQQATRENLRLTARFQLNDAAGNAVFSDLARVTTSYDVLQQPFSDLSSRNDAVERGVDELAAQIQTRLAAYFSK